MRVRHLGNTANNAYYNARLLKHLAGIESELPIRMFGLEHAISAPAWEWIDFEVPGVAWVSRPDWSVVPGAVALNAEFTDLAPPAAAGAGSAGGPGLRGRMMAVARAVADRLYRRRWTQPLFDVPYRVLLARRSAVATLPGSVDLLYGADSLSHLKMEDSSRYACLEHGTVRWIADGARESAVLRRAYREQVARAQQLWVTNLDPRTLEIAEDVAPGRWTAFPHPYVADPRVPFSGSELRRRELLRSTAAEHLILLPSSQNWAKTHDKGSKKALTAFVEMRRAGIPVGLVAVEWGLQLAKSKAFLDEAGVGANVAWVAPMARISLQRMMADVDVVWDQFGLDAFGGLALRAVEQGTPLVSRGLAPAGERLIGGAVPWLQAATVDEIVRQTTGLLESMTSRGRDTVIAETTARYRSWFRDRHAAELTAELQKDVYSRILDGTFEPGSARPDEWARRLGSGIRESG
jgi:hypothetical protein